MFLWRVSNHDTLAGQGGILASGRWHTAGRPVVYFAENAAGALLEALVHLEVEPPFVPKSYGLLKAEAAQSLSVVEVAPRDLPSSWLNDSATTRTVGDRWLASLSSALLRVPSAIVPETWNVLLNPAHEDAAGVRVLWHAEYPWDSRLLT